MKTMTLNINNTEITIEANEDSMLLWVLREQLGLTGTKYSCGIGQCGSCTIHLDGNPIRSCSFPVSSLNKGQKITTIEGLSEDKLHPVQQAWIDAQAPQCGFCQSGQIMQAVALLDENPRPSRSEIRTYMNGNLCRCGTYMRIMEAIEKASEKMSQSS